MKIFSSLLLAAGLLTAGQSFAADTAAAPLRKIAIIVENRAGPQFNDKVPVLEDLVASRVAGKGYSVISRDVAVNALKTYSAAGASSPSQSATTTATTDTGKGSTTPVTTSLDQALSENTSALRLAQNLGADYILIPAITSFGTEKRNYNGNGIATVSTTYKLRVSYKIVEANEGGAVRGSTVLAEKNLRNTGDLQTDSTDVINDLLDDAADQLADAIVTSAKALPTEVAKANLVTFRVACSMTDPRQQPIMVSAIGVSADNKLVTSQPVPVQAMDVTVEVDGVAIGSAPGDFKSRSGLHKLSLSREGFDTWSRTVNLYEGQKLNVALQMSAAGYARWKETTDFLATIDNNRKLTDAEVNRINGIAEFFKNSHYRVDTAENVKVYKSLY
jgi:hypothetical protein